MRAGPAPKAPAIGKLRAEGAGAGGGRLLTPAGAGGGALPFTAGAAGKNDERELRCAAGSGVARDIWLSENKPATGMRELLALLVLLALAALFAPARTDGMALGAPDVNGGACGFAPGAREGTPNCGALGGAGALPLAIGPGPEAPPRSAGAVPSDAPPRSAGAVPS